MKIVYIIRHAKSSWKDMTLDDFDRPLNKRGKRDAPFMGAQLKKKNILLDIIVSSPALRAKITAEVIAKEIGYVKEIVFEKNMYESSAPTLTKILQNLDEKNKIVFLFGHNTEFNIFAEHYIGFDENIPTCGIVEIEFDCKEWPSISEKNATLISFDYPKKYKN